MPWGILASVFAAIAFYCTVALVIVHTVSSAMIATVGGDDGLGRAWWLSLIITALVIAAILFAGCLVLYIIKSIQLKKEGVQSQPFFKKRSVWAVATSLIISLYIFTSIADVVLNKNKGSINSALGLSGTRLENVEEDEDGDYEYFKSNYVQVDSQGNPIMTTDASGYEHQLYDDISLHEADLRKAEEVQREGSVLLWNNDASGKILQETNKVSVFSHSSVAWVCSGGGSGTTTPKPNSNVTTEFQAAGLVVNPDLWNFYNGLGSTYLRAGGIAMHEVPWSLYTDDVKNSFSTYNDAAVLIFSRVTREGSNGGTSTDATLTAADTPTGDYFDLSYEEEDMLNQVLALKENGVFKKVIVILNTPTGMFMDSFVNNKDKIDCCLWVGLTGYQGLHEVANILASKSIATGRLPDTFLFNTSSAPSTVNLVGQYYSNASTIGLSSKSRQGVYLVYEEGIYVGYKYYETRYEDIVLKQGNADSTAGVKNSSGNWRYSEEVAFPFGYSSYSKNFEISNYDIELREDGDYDVKVTITNKGSVTTKDVVQIYVQKPYTEYDKENGIEQASVNLAGYAKTNYLEPNGSENFKILLRKDAFKTYDSHNKKTYIREKTSGNNAYFVTAAHDSHEAINNILAFKGKNPSSTENLMDNVGNSGLVKKFEFAEDDYSTFSKSKQTGNAITNQFDDVDWNRYENKSEANVTYISRNNWTDTYPVTYPILSITTEMLADLANVHPIEANPEDKMPLYGQTIQYMFVDMIGLEYDNPLWEILLNQLTFEEQVKLVGNGYYGTVALESIAKPQDVAADGPLGLKKSFRTNSTEKTMSYPSTTVLAASFNDKLALEVGQLMGEDALHSGVTGIYAPGVNTHRSTYGARNWEYHSEDSFLAGMIAKWRVIGMQEKGCYVNIKHFALNDQETNRHGLNVWCNEQALREIYLNAYEYAITEGGCTGIMSSFTRFGTHWSGSHKGLCTNLVRKEWGFKGFICSDAPWVDYMDLVLGLVAGNDIVLSTSATVNPAIYDVARTNATVAQALRQAVHRILYIVVNSNAMNGFSSGIRVYEVREWWQVLTHDLSFSMLMITIAFTLLTALRFIFFKMLNKEKVEKKEEIDNNVPKEKRKKHIIGPIFISLNALALVSCAAITPFNLESLKKQASENNTSIPLREQIEGELTTYKLEAEYSFIETTIPTLSKEYDGKSASETNNPSGSGFISHLADDGEVSIEFYFDVSEESKVVLGASFGKNDSVVNFVDMYSVEVNATSVKPRKLNHEIAASTDETLYNYDWSEEDIVIVKLNKGINCIEFKKTISAEKMLNLDYVYLASPVEITCFNQKHSVTRFDLNEGNDPFAEKNGGSLYDNDVTMKIEGDAGLYRYGNGNNAVLSSTIVCESDTYALVKMLNDARPGRTFSARMNGASSNNPYIDHFTVNDETEKDIYVSTKAYPSLGWNIYQECELAFVKLKAGENIISYQILGDNINYIGLAIDTYTPVNLGTYKDEENTYVFETNRADDPSIENNEANPFAPRNGGSCSNTSKYRLDTSAKKYVYGDGNGLSFQTTLVVEESVIVSYKITISFRPAVNASYGNSVFSYYQQPQTNSKPNPYIASMSLNDSVANVSPSLKTYESKGWATFDYCEIATLKLNAGKNVVQFLIGGDNINVSGICVESPIPVDLDRNAVVINDYRFDANSATDPSNIDNEMNPFGAANGGSCSNPSKYRLDGSAHRYCYGDGNGLSFTSLIKVEEAVTVTFKIIISFRPAVNASYGNSVFSYYQQAKTNSTANPFIAAMTLNDETTGITPSNKTYASQGWATFIDCEIATLELKAGVNKVFFTIGGDNINVGGIVVSSPIEIKLGN